MEEEATTFVDSILGFVIQALRPLQDALTDEVLFVELLGNLGWDLPLETFDLAVVEGYVGLAQPLSAASQLLETIRTSGEPSPQDLAMLAELVGTLITALERLSTAGLPQELPAPLDDPAFWGAMTTELAAHLIIRYLEYHNPITYAWMLLVGIVDERPPSADPNRSELRTPMMLRWDRLARFVEAPGEILAEVYGWGGPLDHVKLLERCERALNATGLHAARTAVSQEAIDRHYGVGATAPADLRQLRVTLFSERADDDWVDLGIGVLPVPENSSSVPAGIFVFPYATGSLTAEQQIAPSLFARFAGGINASETTGLRVLPDLVEPNFYAGAGRAELRMELAYSPPQPWILMGGPIGTHVQLAGASLVLRAAGSSNQAEAVLGVEFRDLEIIISFAGSDGFLHSFVGDEPARVVLNGGLELSSRRGLVLADGSGLHLGVPLQLRVAALEITGLALGAVVNNSALQIEATVNGSLHIGPVVAMVREIGAQVRLVSDANGPVAGLRPDLLFKPPTGAALSIDSSAITGGGFLFFDPDTAQYSGGLCLKLENITLNAIGLLTTHLPDGSPGFSLLVIVQASGFTPIQLGFGFTLNGVGGLLGINRTVNVDVLRAGMRDRTLDAILFSPNDPTPRAPQIISTLQSVFPPAADRHVFGPTALIGWGAPVTLVTIQVAVILELPSPLRLIVLGRVRAALPSADKPIVSINCDIIGVIDFDQRQLSVDATLYDSMIGPYALSGDMAARASWGENPDFAMALGGFHPVFKPPHGFPVLRRLALALSTGDNPRLRMETYFALTSNTVQVGARLELYASAAGFAIEGGLGFDTLIQFSPFRVLAEMFARLALKRGHTTLMDVDVHANLTGPAPWVVWGEAKFKVFWFHHSISFRAEFGEPQDVPAIEPQDVWLILSDCLGAAGNWSAQLPPDSSRMVVLRAATSNDELLVHPLGTVTISQGLVPLERTLGLFGSVPPKSEDRFQIVRAEIVDTVEFDVSEKTTQYFAPAQFRQMSNAEKLSSPSFERMTSGARLVPSDVIAFYNKDKVQTVPLDYEQVVILDLDEPPADPPPAREIHTPNSSMIPVLAERGPAGSAEVRRQGRKKFAPTGPGPKVADPEFVVVTKDDFVVKASKATKVVDGSYTSAAEWLRHHPERDELQIVRAKDAEEWSAAT